MSGNKILKYEVKGILDRTEVGIGGLNEFYAAVKEVFDYANKSDYDCISTKIDKDNGIISIKLKGANSLVDEIYNKMCDITDNMTKKDDDYELNSNVRDIAI